jgi:hypothetical protein
MSAREAGLTTVIGREGNGTFLHVDAHRMIFQPGEAKYHMIVQVGDHITSQSVAVLSYRQVNFHILPNSQAVASAYQLQRTRRGKHIVFQFVSASEISIDEGGIGSGVDQSLAFRSFLGGPVHNAVNSEVLRFFHL